MKGIRIRSVVLAGALVALASVTARAATITPAFLAFVPGVSITYDAEMSSGEIHPGDGFTIYDIGGFAGFGPVHPDWGISISATGSPFAPPPTLGADLAALFNVHFTYKGLAKEFLGAFTYTPFTVLTRAVRLAVDEWVSKDHTLGTIGVIDGAVATGHQDEVVVPAGVPDSGSTMAFLGLGLIVVGALRWKILG